jgi:hypothetical protein
MVETTIRAASVDGLFQLVAFEARLSVHLTIGPRAPASPRAGATLFIFIFYACHHR